MTEASEFKFRAVGVVHTAAQKDDIRDGRSGITSQIEIWQEFEEALDGIEGFSHIFVIGCLNQLRQEQTGVLKVKPRRLLRFGLSPEELPLLGVFSLDSPSRPNPISLSLAQLVSREGRMLNVADLDLFDGTPVLDIKPYQSTYRTERFAVPGWHQTLHDRAGRA